jgi:hypothetical protein
MTVEEAQAMYRVAWTGWLQFTTEEARHILEQRMDEVQSFRTSTGHSGPEWKAFIDTLPGYRDAWDRTYNDAMSMVNKLGRR